MNDTLRLTPWQRFWHEPVRAERLAATRILLGLAALTDQLFQYLPYVSFFYGPEGVAPAGTYNDWLLSVWRWTILLFYTDDLTVVWTLFWIRLGVTVGFLVGWQTRWMTILLYFLTLCFVNRSPVLKNGADDVLLVGLFLLMFAQSGKAFSLDNWLHQRRSKTNTPQPRFTPAWPVRLLQIQLCIIYLTTGLAKLIRDDIFTGTWWVGSSLHFVFNDVTMGRWSYAQLPLPFWFTAAMTYLAVGWELLFTPMVLFRRTRWLALWFGVFFHIGIWLTIEVGWFSFYSISLYGVWIPAAFWDRFRSQKTKPLPDPNGKIPESNSSFSPSKHVG